MGEEIKKTREKIFFDVFTIKGAPSDRSRREEEMLLLLRDVQNKAIEKGIVGDPVKIIAINDMDISGLGMYGVNFDLIFEIKKLAARETRFSKNKEPRLASIFGHSKIIYSDFSRADMSFCQFSHAFFQDSKFNQAVLENIDAYSSSFKSCSLKNASFKGSRLVGVFFENSDLFNLDFEGSTIFGCDPDFINAQAKPIFAKGTNLLGVSFKKADISLTHFDDILFENTSFRKVNIKDSLFSQCFFKGTDFSQSLIDNVSFGAVLGVSEIDFSRASARDVVFEKEVGFECNFSESEFYDSVFSGVFFSDSDFHNAVFENCDFKNANLLLASNLDTARFVDCDFSGASLPERFRL